MNLTQDMCSKKEDLAGIGKKCLEISDWGLTKYRQAWEQQKEFVEKRLSGEIPDQLILVEHLPVITLGKLTKSGDLFISEDSLRKRGIDLCSVDRGGKATFHGLGQLVAYPIIFLEDKDLHVYVRKLLDSVAFVLKNFGLEPILKKGEPGIWVSGRKIASIGIATKKWVTYHGIALNVNTELSPFSWIVPCGKPSEIITSMKAELGRHIEFEQVKDLFIAGFTQNFEFF